MNHSPVDSHLVKVLLVGDTATGKTSLMHRLCSKKLPPRYSQTIGVEFHVTIISYKEADRNTTTNIKLQIWDTPGEEAHRNIIQSYYRGASIIFIVVDINSNPALKIEKINKYIEEANDTGYVDHVKYCLIETKTDLLTATSQYHKLTDEELGNLKSRFSCHVAVSLFTNENMQELLQKLPRLLKNVIDTNPLYQSREINRAATPHSGSGLSVVEQIDSQSSFSWLWKWFPLFTYSSVPGEILMKKFQERKSAIDELREDEALSLLPLIKDHLKQGNLARYGERYITSVSSDYQDGDQTLHVTDHVLSMLEKIDNHDPLVETGKQLLHTINVEMHTAARSFSVTRVTSTKEYYEKYFPEFLQTSISNKLYARNMPRRPN